MERKKKILMLFVIIVSLLSIFWIFLKSFVTHDYEIIPIPEEETLE